VGAFKHTPVLLAETVDALNLLPGMTVVDATVGGGGHTSEILKRIIDTPRNGQKDTQNGQTGGRMVAIDRDTTAIEHTKLNINNENVKFVHGDFADIGEILDGLGITQIDAVTADLGVSSHQIDTPSRGFSYMNDAPLDMRMDTTKAKTAYHVVNHYGADELYHIIRDFGEERYARRITEHIIANRPVNTTHELAEICKSAVPAGYGKTGGHPAKRTFQAIRIEVNAELEVIEKFIMDAVARLKKRGRIAIITFHSLEDRIVKHTFKLLSTDCLCPPRMPICVCGHRATIKIVTKKPIEPSEQEMMQNTRSHSAKLRVAERI